MTGPRRRSLAWSFAGIGLAQLLLLAAIFMGVGRLANGPPPPPGHRHFIGEDVPAGDEGPGRGGPGPTAGPGGGPGPHHPPPFIRPLTTLFLGGLVVLGIGSLLTARWIVRPLRELSRVANALGNGDLRARSGLRRSDELGDLARAFDEMGARIERLLLAEKELLANVSHELRTPLARIRVALDIVRESNPELDGSMSEVEIDLAELETLIDDILTTTRLEIARGPSKPAHFEIHATEVEPGALCARSEERFRARYPARPLNVSLELGLPKVQADPMLFRRVLDNLLENAHKYSPDPVTPIALRATRQSDGVCFAVEDRGMGIAAEDLPQLFSPFFRADRSRTRGTGGVGLGLTLAKRIVEAHGGTIGVTSALGAGTTVRAVLPERSESAAAGALRLLA